VTRRSASTRALYVRYTTRLGRRGWLRIGTFSLKPSWGSWRRPTMKMDAPTVALDVDDDTLSRLFYDFD